MKIDCLDLFDSVKPGQASDCSLNQAVYGLEFRNV